MRIIFHKRALADDWTNLAMKKSRVWNHRTVGLQGRGEGCGNSFVASAGGGLWRARWEEDAAGGRGLLLLDLCG